MDWRREARGEEPQANGRETTSFAERWAGKFESPARHGAPRYERLARKCGF